MESFARFSTDAGSENNTEFDALCWIMTNERGYYYCFFFFILSLCKGIVFPQWGRRGMQVSIPPMSKIANTDGRTQSNTSIETQDTSEKVDILIRKSQREDLTKVAMFLSTASSPSLQGKGFRARIDRMFAQADIEKLLESRWQAIYEANRSWERICRQVNVDQERPLDVHRHWWTTSDGLRSSIAVAAEMTAEPTMFDTRSMQVMPQPHALQHLQLTATNHNNIPIGFCEVAMEPPHGQPLVLNVAVDPRVRRKGVARRMLRTAERYVRRYWKTGDTKAAASENGMGLYVDPSNHAAIELYLSLGYKMCNDDDASQQGTFEGPKDIICNQPMTYMFKPFSSKSPCDEITDIKQVFVQR